jgi:hypothetical protein
MSRAYRVIAAAINGSHLQRRRCRVPAVPTEPLTPDALVAALVAMTFDVAEATAREHVEAACAVAKEFGLEPELLLGIVHTKTQFAEQAPPCLP